MGAIYRIDKLPVKVVSVHATDLDVDVVSNKNLIILGASKTTGHVIVDSGVESTSTRIMYGDAVAKLIKADGVTEVSLWGNAINRYAILVAGDSVGRLINLNAYAITERAQDDTKLQLLYDRENASYPTYDDAAIYRWDATAEAFVFERDADAGTNVMIVTIGPPMLLNGVLVYLESRTFDVDEDGPHMQKGVPSVGGTAAYTQYSIYKETTTSYYSATMVESEDCDAVSIQLNDGTHTVERYKQMSSKQGLEFLAQMRSVRYRDYAPTGVCAGITQHALAYTVDATGNLVVDAQGKPVVSAIQIKGKESNYSLTNLIKRYDFWPEYIDTFGEEIPLEFPCGILEPVKQQGYVIGFVPMVSTDPAAWSGMRTISVPRIKSYTPRFNHVEYKSTERTLTWQEVTTRSYILFNNFSPEGNQKGLQPFGAGGVAGFGSSYDEDDSALS